MIFQPADSRTYLSSSGHKAGTQPGQETFHSRATHTLTLAQTGTM